jgi:MATE family multidrug resistance protein
MGAPLATSLARMLQLVMLLVYIKRWRPLVKNGTWKGWQLKAALTDTSAMRTLGLSTLASSLIVALESWPLEFSNAVAGFLDIPSLDAHTVVLQTCIFISLGPPLGMAAAASARVPQLLRDNDPVGARHTALVAVGATAAYNLACAFFLLLGRWHLGVFFTADEEVAALCASVALIAALFQLVDGVQNSLAGVLRGLGKSKLVTVVLFVGWACIGLPTAGYFAFKLQRGIQGLWMGLLIGLLCVLSAYIMVFRAIDWTEEARKAMSQYAAVPVAIASASGDDADENEGATTPAAVSPKLALP